MPDFFDKRPPYKSIQEELMQGSSSRLDNRLDTDFILDPHSTLRESVRRILDRGLTRWQGDKPRGGKETFSWGSWDALVVDVGRHAVDSPWIELHDSASLDDYVRKPRRTEKSRKRFQSAFTIKRCI